MKREHLEHVLRAASRIAGDPNVLATDRPCGHCLEPHDLVVAKLVAGRMKDLEFADALLRAGLVAPDTLAARARALEQPFHARRVVAWVNGWTARHGPGEPAAGDDRTDDRTDGRP